jgi:hypothetical protein
MALGHSPSVVTNGLVYCADAGNPRSYSPNTFPIPLDIFGWSGTSAYAATLSRDSTTSPSPAGGIPLKMAISGDDPHIASYNSSPYNVSTAASGQTWTVSVYVKGSVVTTGELFIFGADSGGGDFTFPDYGAGSIAITTDWTRVSYSFTFSNANVAFIQFRLDGTPTGGTGTNIWWDGIQVEQASTPSSFNPMKNTNRSNLLDRSGNAFNSTLTNGPTYNTSNLGSIVFDGVNDFSTVTPTPTVLQGNPDLTVMGFYYRTGSFSSKGFWGIGGSNAGGTAQGICNWNYNNTNEITVDSWGQSTFTTGQTYPLNTWIGVAWRKVAGPMTRANCTISIFNGTMTNYTAGALTILRAEAGTNLAINSIGGITLGSISVDTGYCSPVNISNHYIYSRVLTDTEVLQNFNALRGRYGI